MSVAEEPINATPSPADGPPAGPWWERLRRWLREPKPQFQVGTLRYTGLGMLMIFVWLLWGDFCYMLLDQNVPEILPLKLNSMGAGDTVNAVLNKSLSYLIVFFLAPIVSVRSDRTRTRWGRRIPYLFWSTPFVGLFLVLIGCYESLTNFFTGGAGAMTVLGHSIGRGAVAITIIGILMVGWDIANVFVGTIYYYLFNDVVPTQYLSRFFACFRIVLTVATMAYSRYVLPHSMTHFRTIFVLAGVVYVAGFMAMCLFVREGQYPPPPSNADRGPGFLSSIKTYASECFTHRLYWYFFIANALTYASRSSFVFLLVRNTKSLGLTLDELGKFGALIGGISLALQFPAGWVADRWHPLRVYVLSNIWYTAGILAQCVWIFHDFGPSGNLFYMYVVGLSFMPLKLISDAAELPVYMRLLPKERYGQFASANAMVRAFTLVFSSAAAGAFIGWTGHWFGERRYTWVTGWQFVFQVAAIVFQILLYRQWKLHGGNKNYVPPGTKA